jgi:hypothetical protein
MEMLQHFENYTSTAMQRKTFANSDKLKHKNI